MEDREIKAKIVSLKKEYPDLEVEFDRGRVDSELFKFHLVSKSRRIEKGFGCSFDLSRAFLKARSEFLERKTFLEYARVSSQHIWSSSGFACHVNSQLAAQRAFCEVVERDSFLMSWVAKVPPLWLEDEHVQRFAPRYNRGTFCSKGVDIKIGLVSKVGNVFVAISAIIFEDNANGQVRFAVDTSADYSVPDAIQSVYEGALIRMDTYLTADRSKTYDTTNPANHFCRHAYNCSPSAWFIRGGDTILEYDPPDCTFQFWDVEACGDRLIVSYCDASVQKYFTGETLDKYLDIKRIENVTGVLHHDFNREIHPLP